MNEACITHRTAFQLGERTRPSLLIKPARRTRLRSRPRNPISMPLALPEPGLRLEQDAEWFLVKVNGAWQQIRFHDYASIYNIQGLYERIFYDILKCSSPVILHRALARQLRKFGAAPETLRALDLGAGNGMVGERLRLLGAEFVVGADILPEAARAARRDRPDVYRAYEVLDFTSLQAEARGRLLDYQFNCLTCVAALGFGDIPTAAFKAAIDLLQDQSWIAFTIKEEFVTDPSRSEFATLIDQMTRKGSLEVLDQQRYRHRISTGGAPLHYICFVGRVHG